MLDAGPALHRIAPHLQRGEQVRQAGGPDQGGVYVRPDRAPQGGPTGLLRRPFSVLLPPPLRLDDGQAALPRHLVGDPPDVPESSP